MKLQVFIRYVTIRGQDDLALVLCILVNCLTKCRAFITLFYTSFGAWIEEPADSPGKSWLNTSGFFAKFTPTAKKDNKASDGGSNVQIGLFAIIMATSTDERRKFMKNFAEVDPFKPELVAARKRAKLLCQQLNALRADQTKARKAIYKELFGRVSTAYIEPNFFCDYGSNIFLGEKFYANHNCVILDVAEVHIGDRVLFAPGVQLYGTTHPLDAGERASGKEFCAPIVIGDDCWIGGGAIILAGVTIGAGAVIGAGSVVTGDIPPNVVAVGNPCRVLKTIEKKTTDV